MKERGLQMEAPAWRYPPEGAANATATGGAEGGVARGSRGIVLEVGDGDRVETSGLKR